MNMYTKRMWEDMTITYMVNESRQEFIYDTVSFHLFVLYSFLVTSARCAGLMSKKNEYEP